VADRGEPRNVPCHTSASTVVSTTSPTGLLFFAAAHPLLAASPTQYVIATAYDSKYERRWMNARNASPSSFEYPHSLVIIVCSRTRGIVSASAVMVEAKWPSSLGQGWPRLAKTGLHVH
jgi:hypothetical protein